MSGKESYLKRKHNLDRRYGTCHGRYYGWLKVSRAEERRRTPIIKKPINGDYVGFNKQAVLERDNFTCKWCGWDHPILNETPKSLICNLDEWLKLRYGEKVRYCRFRKSTVLTARICYRECMEEVFNTEYDDPYDSNFEKCEKGGRVNELERGITQYIEELVFKKLSAHHILEDKTKNSLSDLITVCKSCHMLYHARRRKGLSISKAQSEVQRIKK